MSPAKSQPVSFSRTNRQDGILFMVCLAALVGLVVLLVPIVPEAFRLHFNPYSLISISGLLLNLALLVVLLRRSDRSNSVLWFAFFIVFGLLWSAAEAMERSATTPVGAVYWGDIISGVTPFLPAYFYLFVRSYTSKIKTNSALWVPVIIIGTAGMMGALMAGNNVFRIPAVSELEPWGYPGPNSKISLLFITWAGILTFSAVFRLIKFYRRSNSQSERRLAIIFITSATGLLVISGLTEVILPSLGIDYIPPLGVFSNALLALGVIFGIYRYGSFSVGAHDIADTVLSTMAGGVVVTDMTYQVLYSNQRAAELISPDGRDLTGRNLEKLNIHRRGGDHYVWEQILNEQPVANIPSFELERGDSPMILDLKVTKLQALQSGYVFIMNDVTALKRSNDILTAQAKELAMSQSATLNLLEDARDLEADLKREKAGVERKVAQRTSELESQRQSLESIVNGVDFGIYTLGPDLHVILVNKAMQNLFTQARNKPYSLEEFDADIASCADTQEDLQKALKTRLPVERKEFTRGNQILRSFRSPIFEDDGKNSKLLNIINVIEDITESKAAQRSRDEFFSIASHELRTPLTAIRGNTSMIQDYFADQLKDPALKDMIGDIHDSSIRLITIVNDFLNTSRLEQGKIEFKIEPFEPVGLIDEVIKEFKAGDSGAKVPLRVSLQAVPSVSADRDRLKEVLINLIGNAIKFTDTGTITVGLAMDGKQVKFSVIDTGKGIPEESQNLLFRKFQQASNNILTRDSTRSTGLGLYISKMIINGMGGKIFLEHSEVGKGATFVVVLPPAKPQKVKPSSPLVKS